MAWREFRQAFSIVARRYEFIFSNFEMVSLRWCKAPLFIKALITTPALTKTFYCLRIWVHALLKEISSTPASPSEMGRTKPWINLSYFSTWFSLKQFLAASLKALESSPEWWFNVSSQVYNQLGFDVWVLIIANGML